MNYNGRINGGQHRRDYPKDETTPLTRSSRSSKSSNQDHPRPSSRRELLKGRIALVASLLTVILCSGALIAFVVGWKRGGDGSSAASPSAGDTTPAPFHNRLQEDAAKLYDDNGRYILEDYDVRPPFSDFLPALAGYYGKPLYAFYVNRGQAIASFGVKSKDYPIMEFQSANVAYQVTALTGFRTFIQGYRSRKRGMGFRKDSTKPEKKQQFLVEPFSALQSQFRPDGDDTKTVPAPKRYMYVGSNELQLREIDRKHGIETNASFYILPEEDFGAFSKRTTVTNLDEHAPLTISMLDGLTKMEPAGGEEMGEYLKMMGRTLEGWMGVYQPYNDTISMPFYRLSTQPGDAASVTVQEAGHWCLSIIESPADEDEQFPEPKLLPIIFDPSKVFGDDTTLLYPVGLHSKSVSEIVREKQYGFAKTASAFAAVEDVTLAPGESLIVTTYFGKADKILDVPVIARRLLQAGFSQYKMTRTREIIQQITAGVETKTANPLFDGHVQQMFLDNSLRGGIPSILGEVDDDAKMRSADEDERLKVYHLFSRIHGDLERDYNDFVIEPTFFSQVRARNVAICPACCFGVNPGTETSVCSH
jgi:hypothetical protein